MIVLKNVSKVFNNKNAPITAVDNVSLQVGAGEIFGVVGYSGAGKSTLIRLLNGLETPSSGTVMVADENISQARGERLRQARLKIGMIFQHFNLLWSRTVADNIAFSMQIAGQPKAAVKRRVNELIALVGLQGREQAYPAQLSGGQKQRVGIARALANDPAVLLCDEATSALDPQTTDAILDLLLNINRQLKLTIVLITHEMHVVRKICHQMAVMENGQIVEQGSVAEVFNHPRQVITRQFVHQASPLREEGPPLPDSAGAVLRLQFNGAPTGQPVVADLILTFRQRFSILQGTLSQAQDGVNGQLWLQVPPSDVPLDTIRDHLAQQGVATEVIRHD